MRAGISKPLIFVVILVLVFTLVYSSVAISNEDLFSKIRKTSKLCDNTGLDKITCCWNEYNDRGTKKTSDDLWLGLYCQTCTGAGSEVVLCEDAHRCPPCPIGPETPQPLGPFGPPQGGGLEHPSTNPTGPQGNVGGQGGGVLEQPASPPRVGPFPWLPGFNR